MVEAARAQLTPEQLAHYKEVGEMMYNSIDFTTGQALTEAQKTGEAPSSEGDPLIDSVAYITEALKSGLAPEYLSTDEISVMDAFYRDTGVEWRATYARSE